MTAMTRSSTNEKARRPSPWLRPLWWINGVAVAVLLITMFPLASVENDIREPATRVLSFALPVVAPVFVISEVPVAALLSVTLMATLPAPSGVWPVPGC